MDLQQKLNLINEDIGFLEEVSNRTPEIEEKIENLRLLRYELEKEICYDQRTTFETNSSYRK